MRTAACVPQGLIPMVALLSFSCASVDLTPAAQRVRVTANPEVVKGCQFLGNVHTDNMMGVRTAENVLQNEAAKLGADVLLEVSPVATGGSLSFHGTGEAYRCSGPQKAPEVPVYKLKAGDQIVSEDLVPLDQRLKPLPGYDIITVRGDRKGDGRVDVFQVYVPKAPLQR